MIYSNSRYFDGPLQQVPSKSKNEFTIAVFRDFPLPDYIRYNEYTWMDGDSIDSVADRFLGDSNAWWQIMDINPRIAEPGDITPGTVLRIPHV